MSQGKALPEEYSTCQSEWIESTLVPTGIRSRAGKFLLQDTHMKKLVTTASLIATLLVTPALAEEPYTEVGIYLFATEISGEAQLGRVTADIDMSFSDILDNLDIGFMGYVEHRRGQWSFIGDLAFLRLNDDNSTTVGRNVELDVEAELEQTVIEGFAGYRFLDKVYEGSDLGVDLMFGLRHNTLKVTMDLDVAIAEFSNSRSRSEEEDWFDYVVGLRFQSDYRNGWGSTVWADLGEGSDSSSYQLLAMVNYQGSSNWKFYGGYRVLSLDYDNGSGDSTFAIDLDYSGPMAGVTYVF